MSNWQQINNPGINDNNQSLLQLVVNLDLPGAGTDSSHCHMFSSTVTCEDTQTWLILHVEVNVWLFPTLIKSGWAFSCWRFFFFSFLLHGSMCRGGIYQSAFRSSVCSCLPRRQQLAPMTDGVLKQQKHTSRMEAAHWRQDDTLISAQIKKITLKCSKKFEYLPPDLKYILKIIFIILCLKKRQLL